NIAKTAYEYKNLKEIFVLINLPKIEPFDFVKLIKNLTEYIANDESGYYYKFFDQSKKNDNVFNKHFNNNGQLALIDYVLDELANKLVELFQQSDLTITHESKNENMYIDVAVVLLIYNLLNELFKKIKQKINTFNYSECETLILTNKIYKIISKEMKNRLNITQLVDTKAFKNFHNALNSAKIFNIPIWYSLFTFKNEYYIEIKNNVFHEKNAAYSIDLYDEIDLYEYYPNSITINEDGLIINNYVLINGVNRDEFYKLHLFKFKYDRKIIDTIKNTDISDKNNLQNWLSILQQNFIISAKEESMKFIAKYLGINPEQLKLMLYMIKQENQEDQNV
ncbi:MAG: hypothetical protein ACP5LM_04760, partial [Thermoplasmata archaeon]